METMETMETSETMEAGFQVSSVSTLLMETRKPPPGDDNDAGGRDLAKEDER